MQVDAMGPDPSKDEPKNRKIDFSFDSALFASFIKIGPFLRGEGGGEVCISLVGKSPYSLLTPPKALGIGTWRGFFSSFFFSRYGWCYIRYVEM